MRTSSRKARLEPDVVELLDRSLVELAHGPRENCRVFGDVETDGDGLFDFHGRNAREQ